MCAAGFRISMHKFKSQFTKIPCEKGKLAVTEKDVEEILFTFVGGKKMN